MADSFRGTLDAIAKGESILSAFQCFWGNEAKSFTDTALGIDIGGAFRISFTCIPQLVDWLVEIVAPETGQFSTVNV